MLSSIGTRVVSGFGGMWDRIDSILPPNLIADMQVRWDAIH